MADGEAPAGLADLERDGFLLVPVRSTARRWQRGSTSSTTCTAAA